MAHRVIVCFIFALLDNAIACEPKELVELREELTRACLESSASEVTCNNELAKLRVMEQDAKITTDWVNALNEWNEDQRRTESRTIIRTLKLEK